MVQKRLTSPIGRRDFLRYAGFTGMTVSMAGVLAACKDAETTSSGSQGSARRRSRRSTRSPAACRSSTGPGTATATTTPRRRRSSSGASTRRPPATRPSSPCSRTTTRRTRRSSRGPATTWRTRADTVQGLGRPRGAPAVGHLVDPELRELNPKLMTAGQFDGSSTSCRSTGHSSPPREPRPRRRQRRDVQRAVRRAVQGQDLLDRHAQHDGGRRLRARHREPLGHDRRGARRGARLPGLEEGARAVLLEPVL